MMNLMNSLGVRRLALAIAGGGAGALAAVGQAAEAKKPHAFPVSPEQSGQAIGLPDGGLQFNYTWQSSRCVSNSAEEIALSVAGPPGTISQNAPIPADLTITNRVARAVDVDLGLDEKNNLKLTITDPKNRAVTVQTKQHGGFVADGRRTLAPGGAYVKRLVLNEWGAFDQIGLYRVDIALTSSDGVESDEHPSTQLMIQIGRRDPVQLQQIAKQLADRAIGEGEGEGEGEGDADADAAKALGWLVDPVAIPSLARVLRDGGMLALDAIDGLQRIGGPDALALLGTLESHPNPIIRIKASQAISGINEGRWPSTDAFD